MKAAETSDFIARILKQSVEDKKFTGAIDIHIDCSQGSMCKAQVAVSERKTSIFEMTSGRVVADVVGVITS